LENLPPPFAELRKALKRAEDKAKIDEVEKDAVAVAALVLYKTLMKNAGAYREWAGWYDWARGLVERQVFTVAAEEVKRLRGSQKRLEEVAEEVRRELNRVLVLYSQSGFYKERPDLLNKLKQLLEVDVEKAEELAKARSKELSKYSDANMGTKVYAALLSVAKDGIYGHAATLFMVEGALADVVLLTPLSAYEKADDIAGRRGEAVDPSRSRRGAKAGKVAGGRGDAADWEERATSTLLRFLIGYGEADLKFRRVEKGGREGFQVFRTFGGVDAFVGELWIEKTAYFTLSKEELRRFVEVAKETAPDLSGIKKIWHALPWFATDASFSGRQIVAGTAHLWQAAWYMALFGEPESISGGASVTKEGIKPNVTMYWPREVLDRIIAEEGEELEPLLGRAVKSWRELVDAIDWSRVWRGLGS
jgi:hypothetical protein